MIRATDWNRFQEKMRKGNTQIFCLGWNADYPDPENFLFLLHGPQSRAKTQGENAANYQNPEYDRLFERMKNMPNGPSAQAIIDRMVEIARADAPWVWGFHPKDYGLRHAWVANDKPNTDGAQQPQVPAHRPGAARRAARRVEPAGAVADRAAGRSLVLVRVQRVPAVVSVPRGASAWRAQARPDGRCSPTSSAACCTRSRS